MIRVAIAGANGRMGRQLIHAVQESPLVSLGAALVRRGSSFYGCDAGEMAGLGKMQVMINCSLHAIKDDFDTLIDFTSPEFTIEALAFCRHYGKQIVIGTTGFNDTHKELINNVAKDIGIVLSANFSVGVNVMLKLIEKTARIIGETTDIEIIESHHRNKIDAPSGTALAMGEVIANVLGRDLYDCAVYNRSSRSAGKRKKNTIGFATLRAGDIVGEHTAIFADIGEILEITHKASSRVAFAKGALIASTWLDAFRCGLFNMLNVLSLDKI